MPFGISVWELLILLVVLLLIFGAKRLPEMGRSLGKGMREFKDSVTGVEEAVSAPEPAPPAALPSASSDPVAAPPSEAEAEEAKRETAG
jgi:TatA/E family protein of Tat protein translocase